MARTKPKFIDEPDMAAAGPVAVEGLVTMPGHLLRRTQQIATSLFFEECGRDDLTSVQYAALVAIRDNPATDATRLSALIAFDRSTLGDVLERLEAKGWIARVPSPSDRRIKLLELTGGGERLLEQVEPAVLRVQDRLLEPLARTDRATLMRLLALLVDAHTGRSSPTPEPPATSPRGRPTAPANHDSRP